MLGAVRPMSRFVVYAIRSGDFVKFGISKNPKDRLDYLQTGNPIRLQLVGSVRGGRRLEKKIHKYLASHRASGEWFKIDEVSAKLVLAFKDSLRDAVDEILSQPSSRSKYVSPYTPPPRLYSHA